MSALSTISALYQTIDQATESLIQTRFVTMRAQDVPQVVAVENTIYAFPWTAGNFSDSLQAGYTVTLLLNQRNVLLGYFVLMCAVDEMHLLNLSVAQQHQGQGYGTQLLQHIFETSHTVGKQRILLEVRPSNPRAVALYIRSGFTQIGVRKGYYPAHASTREDALVMEKLLCP